MTDRLDLYHRKRRFDETPEPSGRVARKNKDKVKGSAVKKTSSRGTQHALSYLIPGTRYAPFALRFPA
ncbi:hypothetical protein P3T21_007468 [Paraburkholderia sp. GAS334]